MLAVNEREQHDSTGKQKNANRHAPSGDGINSEDMIPYKNRAWEIEEYMDVWCERGAKRREGPKGRSPPHGAGWAESCGSRNATRKLAKDRSCFEQSPRHETICT